MIKSVDKNQSAVYIEKSVNEFEQNGNEFEQNLEQFVEHCSSKSSLVNIEMDLVGSELIEPSNSLHCDYSSVT